MTACTKGLEFSKYFYAPELFLHDRSGDYYKKHPFLTRVVAVLCATPLSLAKQVLFPVWSLVGVLALPIVAGIRGCMGAGGNAKILTAWSFSLLGLVGFLTYVALAVYTFNLLETAVIYISFSVVSLVIHVDRACQTPRSIEKEADTL